MPRALWRHAPLVLLRHPAVLAAVLAASFLVSAAAASGPLLRAGARSEALKGRLADLTPLGAGLTVETKDLRAADVERADSARRAAALRLGRTLPHTTRPVLSTSTSAQVGGKVLEGGRPLEIVPMARDGATAHVQRLAGRGDGVWLTEHDAELARVGPGDDVQLLGGLSFRVGAVYRQLDEDLDNPYWVDFIARIRAVNPDAPPRPNFLLMSRAQLYRVAHVAHDTVQNTFEFPVDAGSITPARARAIDERFTAVARELRRDTPLARELGCPCSATSPISSAVVLAAESVDALTPVISLLAGFAALLAVGAAFVAGLFNVRRRDGEARLSVVNGEARTAFAARAALETAIPAAVGAAAGFACAAALVRAFTPDGTVDGGVVRWAAAAAALAALAAVGAVAAGAWLARGPLVAREARAGRLFVPWEIPVLAAAGVLLLVIRSGGGLTRNSAVGAHPRLVVLFLPLLAAAGFTGVLSRLLRRALRSSSPRRDELHLAVRRLVAARSLLVLLTVTAAVAVAALTFAEVLHRTLVSSSVEKAYVANGSDVQGVIDPTQGLPAPLPYPAARVVEDFSSGRVDGSPRSLEVLAVRPAELARVVHVGALDALARSTARLPAIANASARHARAIWFNGRRVPVQVVAVVRTFPGMAAGEDLLVVPEEAFGRAVPQPYESATAYIWVRGDPHAIVRALARANPSPAYVSTVDEFLRRADLSTAARTYGYLRAIALGAAIVALVALVLYLHARARTQLVTAELLRRMGMGAGAQAVAVAIEACLLVLFAGLAGVVSALLTARPLVARLDPLPQYAPAVALDVPWLTLAISLLVLAAAAAAAGAASVPAARGDVAEAVRVA